MNAKLVIYICLLVNSISCNEFQGAENITNTLPSLHSQNETSIKLEKKIDLSVNNATTSNNEESGFLSKLNNFIFGSNDDAEAAESHQSVQYGPPPPPASRNAQQRDCNPCNKEPWIPIMTSYGHNQLEGFMQSHDLNNGNGGLYNKHNIATDSYGTPVGNQEYQRPPQSSYTPPSSHILENFKPPSSDYGSPNVPIPAPQDLYGPPASAAVRPNYGTPSAPPANYGLPLVPSANYGPPSGPPANYGPSPSPHVNYGPPPSHPANFGPSPPPSSNYGPPQTPPSNYGPPQPSLDYGAPASAPAYSAPSGFNEPPPVPASISAPAPATNFGTHYGAPKPIYKIPSINYGPPVNQHNFGLPKHGYPSGKAPRQIRPGFQSRPYMPFGPPPPPPQPSYKYIPLKGKYSNLPTDFKPPPPPPNYNSGGSKFTTFGSFLNHGGPSQNFISRPQITNPEYLPPKEQLPIATGHNAEPIALPNLSSRPVAPLHNAQNFLDNFPQPGSHVEIPYESSVQIQQSIPIADFVASIEHPINVIRAPILDVTVANTSSQSDSYYQKLLPPPPNNDYRIPQNNPISDNDSYDDYRLSDNPIVVEDTHVAAATNENRTVSNFNNLHSGEVGEELIQDVLYGISGQQTPTPATSMQPPPIGESFWLAPNVIQNHTPNLTPNFEPSLTPNFATAFVPNFSNSGRNVENTKKPKQIQIIIPYTTNNEYDKKKQFLPVPNDETYQSSELKQVTTSPKQPASVVNIQDLFKHNNNRNHNFKDLPFDIIHLQKNIDDWTEQEYSKNILENSKTSAATLSATSTTKFIPSKRIPDDYLTTLPYNSAESKLPSTTTRSTPKYLDHEPAGSNSKEYLQSNLIATTEQPTTPKFQKHTKLPNWDKIHIAVSPLTKEKIYVVTPQPKTAASSWRQSRENEHNATFSISIMPMRNKTTESNDVRVVLSEWPHLINNLATITKSPSTSSTTTTPPTSRHPLFGLMDLSSYTPSGNATIETYSGHSKVINVATASLKKRGISDEGKVTTTMKSQTLN